MNIVSFGGGTNSTAMIIGMHLRKIPIDYIIFADTETDCFLKKNASIAKRFRRLRSASRLVLKNTKYAHPKSS